MATQRLGKGKQLDSAPQDATVVERVQDTEGLWINLSKQAKFIVLGGLPVWYLDVPGSLAFVLRNGGEDWTRTLALVALAFLLSTMALFAYVILLPARGVTPNVSICKCVSQGRSSFLTLCCLRKYANWNRDEHLRGLIPALTVSIVGGYITLLLLLSPLCNPTPSLQSVLPTTLADRISAAALAAGSNVQDLSRNVQGLASRASSALYTGLHRPAVAVKSSNSWFSSGRNAGSASGGIDTKRLLAALKLSDTASLGQQLQIPAKRLSEFSSTLERSLQGISLQTLQTSLAQVQQTAREASSVRQSPYWWAKRGTWGWIRALVGSGCAYLLVFGTMGLLGLFGTSQAAIKRRQEAKAKASL